MQNNQPPQWTADDILALFQSPKNPEAKVKYILWAVGIFLTPITLAGAVWGFIRAYNRKLYKLDVAPTLAPLHPFARVSMIIFAVGIWVVLLVGFFIISHVYHWIVGSNGDLFPLLAYLTTNLFITVVVMVAFNRWREKMFLLKADMNRYGSAKWATNDDLRPYEGKKGLYIGGGYTYPKQGHLLSVAGTRSGKFTNLIAPNLLGIGGYDGSWFVIDPKGECAYVTANYQRQSGKDVRVIDPWKVYSTSPDRYNPLDVMDATNTESLGDDAAMIAEMIVPEDAKTSDPFWNDRARSLITALIIHCVIEGSKGNCSRELATVWRWLRKSEEDFKELLTDMAVSDNEIVALTATEVQSVMVNSEKTFGSIMSSCHSQTDFLKSSALQDSMSESSFDINGISDGKTALYLIIPPDKMNSQSKWLRLVVATSLRAVVRTRNKRVTFILDEFPSLGKINDVSSFMAMGAGYNITLWPIFQSLSQLQAIYGSSWQVFMAGASVKHFFGINDAFTAEHVSGLAGKATYVVYDRNVVGDEKGQPNARPLVTADEIRRGSSDKIFTFIDQNPIAEFQKWPYYEMKQAKERSDRNPYYEETIGV
ncbi:type IV secretory system conjugative DNA transfer family protein [Dyadobacter jiangsuensis]|uniref:Type IV secretion system protein VirD4 n=1 Tax=Dyadobacter jiangsuensis TaxID=1591085 RepID=A0A2P8FP45_9BACT|nr:type IV secretory system conjugative DNA transfer family protein [Dyadobacter jiangsuensis]PSL23498.1 type IV secretion system protein VirD4 [Dyadobacter jiangsuensis]